MKDGLLPHLAEGSVIVHDMEKAHKGLVKAAKCTDETGKRLAAVAAEQAEVDPGEDDLELPLFGTAPRFGHDVVYRAADGRAAARGNDTVGAVMVAAILHFDEGPAVIRRAVEPERIPSLAHAAAHRRDALRPRGQPDSDEPGDLGLVAVTDEQVNTHFRGVFLGGPLRPTAAGDDAALGTFAPITVDQLPALTIGNGSHRTGNDDGGVIRSFVHDLGTAAAKLAAQRFCFGQIGAAAES